MASRSPFARRFGRRIRELRKARGLSLRALAERTGEDPADVSRIENGKGPQNPGARRIGRFAGALGVQPGALLDDSPANTL